MAGQEHKPDTFLSLYTRLDKLLSEVGRTGDWTSRPFRRRSEEIAEILAGTYRLLGKQEGDRPKRQMRALEALQRSHLYHDLALIEFNVMGLDMLDEMGYEPTEKQIAGAMEDFLYQVLFYLQSFTVEYPQAEMDHVELSDEQKAILASPDLETLEGRREYVAKWFSWSTRTLDNLVSKRKQEGDEFPWVIRKDGIQWDVNVEKFDEWKVTSDAQEKRRKRGRPRKSES